MSAQSDLVAAIEALEVDALAMGQDFTNYVALYRAAASERYAAASAETASRDVAVLEHAIGPHRVAQLLCGRLLGLGAGQVVTQLGARTPSGPEWVAYFTDQIEHHVPEVVVASRAG